MSAFELIELSFDPEEAKPTLEDEFTYFLGPGSKQQHRSRATGAAKSDTKPP